MTKTAKKTPMETESLVSLVEGILASRESPSPELQAKQLRLLRILAERGNQQLPAGPRKAEGEDTPPPP